MMARQGLGAALVAVLLVGCSMASDSVTRRFVLDIQLLVDGRPYSGSGVWEMTTQQVLNPLGNAPPLVTRTKGEAIAIPIVGDRVAFVLRRQRHHVTTEEYGGLLWDCGVRDLAELRTVQGPCEVRRVPEVVVTSPAEAGQIPKLAPLYETAAGDVVIEIVSLTVTGTDAPVTTGLSANFPWVSELPDAEPPGRTPSESSIKVRLPNKYYRPDFTLE